MLRILLCIIQLQFLRANVFHITGDIHYLALGLIGRNVVLTIHDLGPLHRKTGLGKFIFKLLWYIWPIRIASTTTAISEATKQELVDSAGADPEKIQVIPNCVSPAFTYEPKSWPEVPTVLMIGTKPNKNLERMFEALQGMMVEVRVIGILSEEQRKKIAQCNVSFSELGLLSDSEMIRTYRECDLLAFASTYEGFGLPILEAQATGRLVLTSCLEPMTTVGGEGVILVDPQDVDSIREGFRMALEEEELREEFIEKGLDNVRKYNSSRISHSYAELYYKAFPAYARPAPNS